MQGSLIDSHRRSSLNSNETGGLSTSAHSNASSTRPSVELRMAHKQLMNTATSPPDIETKPLSRRPDDVIEYDEDEKAPSTPVTHSADFFRWQHGHRRVMLTFGTICLFAFMTGVEYAVILPTAFDYVKTMTHYDIYVGLILSSYSISGSIAGVIMGKISDITGKVKILILVSNIFEIGGNILYFVTNNIHIVLLGRLIAGVGMGAVPPVRNLFILFINI
jgi:hypothetical protein